MSMVIFNRYNNIGEALVAFSTLEAFGFHPRWHNYYHAHNAIMAMMAFGGIIILIPGHEAEDAHSQIAHIQSLLPLEGDEIPENRLRWWRPTLLFFSCTSFGGSNLLPVLFLLPRWKIGIALLVSFWLILGITFQFTSDAYLLMLTGFGIAMLGTLGLAALLYWPIVGSISLATLSFVKAIWLGFDWEFAITMLTLGLYLLMNLHAKYIALPRLREETP